MPVITTNEIILDSAGKPATGFVYCRLSEVYLPTLTTAYRAVLTGGKLYAEDGHSQLELRPTPPGLHMFFLFETRELDTNGAPAKHRVSLARDIPEQDEAIEFMALPVADGYGIAGRILALEPDETIPTNASAGDMFIEQSGRYGKLKEA
jgi:hypothetical protein